MPLRRDPAKRARQLSNLRPGAGQWRPGASPALRHGGTSVRPGPLVLDPIVAELAAELGEGAPVRDEHGAVPAHDRAAVESAAIDVLIVRRVHGFLELHGWSDPQTGNMRPEVEYLGKANQRLVTKLGALGMTPTSRARLGLDLTRQFDLAAAMAADGEAERRELELGERREPGGGDDG